ncbi:hypothetical protein PTI45_00466 [Paenibacillus nuruki]|uniref:Uncharacterized protein n=2 Tax=Paenibacillus nuruki TaxID=1886670 RepID=A0A1E3L8J8_9BACL|nr:hypothetical protein PTI45_00466 [Paenibacillus nuruki]
MEKNIENIKKRVDLSECKELFSPCFLEWDQCVLLYQSHMDTLPNYFVANPYIADRTAFEAYYNYVHLDDCVDSIADSHYLLKIAIEIIEIWKVTLFKQ